MDYTICVTVTLHGASIGDIDQYVLLKQMFYIEHLILNQNYRSNSGCILITSCYVV